jgi:F420-dependent oxidoreductase-like protein
MENHPIRFGVFVPQGWRMDLTEIRDPVEQYEAMARVAKSADAEAALDSIWLYDHFHTIPEPTLETTFECWTSVAALARDTQRVKIGQLVTCNGYRHPSVLAKMASTVDVLSHGRLVVGLGAGWYEHEWNAYGLRFPETPVRMGMFSETCEIVTRMWTEDQPRFVGKYYQLDGPINRPRGVQQPHIPLWIGGGGERVTLRLVARWGDACNVSGGPDQLRHKFAVLRRHCDSVGRDYETIIRSTAVEEVYLVARRADVTAARERLLRHTPAAFEPNLIVATPDEVAGYLREKVAAGVNYVIVYLRGVAYEPEQVEWFAREVVPRVNV